MLNLFSKKINDDNFLSPELETLNRALIKKNEELVHQTLISIIRKNIPVMSFGKQDQSGNFSIELFQRGQKKYALLYTARSERPPSGDTIDICFSPISKLLDFVYGDHISVDGLAIDPYTHGYLIDKRSLSRTIDDCRRGMWAPGIPATINRFDIMNDEDLLDFAIEALSTNLFNEPDYKIMRINYTPHIFPNMIVKHGSEIMQIAIKVGVAPMIPAISQTVKEKLVARAATRNAVPYFASMSFGSTDEARFYKSLALRGDAYHLRFPGLEKLE